MADRARRQGRAEARKEFEREVARASKRQSKEEELQRLRNRANFGGGMAGRLTRQMAPKDASGRGDASQGRQTAEEELISAFGIFGSASAPEPDRDREPLDLSPFTGFGGDERDDDRKRDDDFGFNLF